VLVLQHRRLPSETEHPTPTSDGRLRLAYDRSGWCSFEREVAALLTVGGGHAYELGVGRVQVQFRRRRSVEEMEAFFRDEEVIKFTGSADREVVVGMYKELRENMDEVEKEQSCWLRLQRRADQLLAAH
jgi:hypothetical protein